MGSPSQAYLDLGPTESVRLGGKRITFLRVPDRTSRQVQQTVEKLITDAQKGVSVSAPLTAHPFKLAEIEKKLSELGLDYRSFRLGYSDLPKSLHWNTSYRVLDEIIRRIELAIHMKKLSESYTETNSD